MRTKLAWLSVALVTLSLTGADPIRAVAGRSSPRLRLVRKEG
jgi:hypothetical protein